MKMKLIGAVALLATSSLAVAGEAVELTAAEMDGVTAGGGAGIQFNLLAYGGSTATTQIAAAVSDTQLAVITSLTLPDGTVVPFDLTGISVTTSAVSAAGIAQGL